MCRGRLSALISTNKPMEAEMAKKSNSSMAVISIVLMVLGIGLAVWGYQQSGSVGSKLTQTFTGSFTDKVMILYISGAVSFIAGLYLKLKK